MDERTRNDLYNCVKCYMSVYMFSGSFGLPVDDKGANDPNYLAHLVGD